MSVTSRLSPEVGDPKEWLQQLNAMAEVVIDPRTPARRYYHSGNEMMRMAGVYEEEGHLDDAYVLYLRYTILFLDKIRTHPDFGGVPQNVKQESKALLKRAIAKAEELRPQVDAALRRRHRARAEERRRAAEDRVRRERAEEERRRRERDALESKLTALAAAREKDFEARKLKLQQQQDEFGHLNHDSENDVSLNSDGYAAQSLYAATEGAALSVPSAAAAARPTVDRTTKPKNSAAAVSAYSADGGPSPTSHGLRRMVVPDSVVRSFLDLAAPNTRRNVETCAILSGCLQNHSLIITDMVVPKQTGTADSCTTSHEEEIFDYQEARELITLGWIHTHPTQTAFLSSVDLHSHVSYQLMMPEAIAIVCAPKHQETRILMLTPDNGVQYIANCPQTGFHLHDDPNLFMDAPHVSVEPDLPLVVKDFRSS